MRRPARTVCVGPAGTFALSELQTFGNRATAAVLVRQAERGETIYGHTAGRTSALPESAERRYRRLGAAGDTAGALQVVVAAMRARGELDDRLLRIRRSGRGLPARPLWRIAASGDLGASVSFAPAFTDPDGRARLPNPRFTVDPRLLDGGASHLPRLHTILLHEYRHVEQQFEHLNTRREGGQRQPGYCNDPDEFDAYLAELEAGYDAAAMTRAAVHAAAIGQSLSATDRTPFASRWAAAERRFEERFGYPLTTVLRTSMAAAFRRACRNLAERAGAAHSH